MKLYGKPDFGLTGSMAESEVFGEIKKSVEFERWQENHDYMTRKEAMQLVRDSQPGDPSDPKPRFANDLHATIAEIIYPDDYSQVKFFTAVGSPLDYLHKIDAFFEINDGDFTDIITIDLKTYQPEDEEMEALKADILLIYPKDGLDPKLDKEDYHNLIQATADDIIKAFGKKKAEKLKALNKLRR